MRYFKLMTISPTNPVVLDITTKDIFFHNIGGLGFDEDADFRSVGDVWWLNAVSYKQVAVTGNILFTDYTSSPYTKYMEFMNFIHNSQMIMVYYPHGPEGVEYRRNVRLTKADKTELNEYGVLDVSVEFSPYTPWYQSFTTDNAYKESEDLEDNTGWIWGGPNTNPLVFEPTDLETQTKAKFRHEVLKHVKIDASTNNKNPVKLSIYGPITNPSWSQNVNGERISSGGFSASSNVVVNAGEVLVIDNTNGLYSMCIYNVESGALVSDVYALRNFNLPCFMYLQEGENRISVGSPGNEDVRIELEGHIYYATV